jgi:hypothetical protein
MSPKRKGPKTDAVTESNPIRVRVMGAIQVRIGTGKAAVLHTFHPFDCQCEDQTYRDHADDLKLCTHIRGVREGLAHLIAAGQRDFPVSSKSRNGRTYNVTIAWCTCGGTKVTKDGIVLCEAGIQFYGDLHGWKDGVNFAA